MSNFFKNLFENYEEQPAPEMWEKVMADVKHHNKVVRARKIAGVASLVVAGGVAALLLVNNNSENTEAETIIAQDKAVETVATQVPESVVVENETMQPAAQAQQENKIVAPVSKNTTAQTQVAKAEAENTVAVATAEKTVVATPEKQNVAVAEQTTKAEPSRAATNVAATATTTNNTLAETSQPAKTVVANKMRSGTNPDTTSTVTDEQVKIIVPTAFTPDKSENNQFYVTCNHPDLVKSFELSIFTRNGLMVFHTKDINERWDGKYKGRVQNMGAYAYVLIYTTASGQKEVQKGSITIIR